MFAVNCCDIFRALFQGSLFFAGEATDQGHYGTVTGAMLVSGHLLIPVIHSHKLSIQAGVREGNRAMEKLRNMRNKS